MFDVFIHYNYHRCLDTLFSLLLNPVISVTMILVIFFLYVMGKGAALPYIHTTTAAFTVCLTVLGTLNLLLALIVCPFHNLLYYSYHLMPCSSSLE